MYETLFERGKHPLNDKVTILQFHCSSLYFIFFIVVLIVRMNWLIGSVLVINGIWEVLRETYYDLVLPLT